MSDKIKYCYIGSSEIKQSVVNYPVGTPVNSKQDLKLWIEQAQSKLNYKKLIIATFVIDLEENLRLASRHSEHIACAGGKEVLSAGEIFFILNNNEYEVVEISNQSTGFCPEPRSWFWVEKALNRININHPGKFTNKFIFRQCWQCNHLNIVKNNIYLCGVCNSKLDRFWNCDRINKSNGKNSD